MRTMLHHFRLRVALPLALASIAAIVSTGCSTSFNRQWREAGATRQETGGLVGRWQGTWLSGKNAHTGKLKCVVTHKGGSDYEFYYWATYWKIFRATYRIDVQAVEQESGDAFSGKKDLGRIFGGEYSHEGQASDGRITATYECKIDHGTFDMTKVAPTQLR